MKQNLQLYRPVVLVLIGALVLVTAISAVVSPSWAYLVIGVAVAAVLYTLFYVLRADRILANYLTSLGHIGGEMRHEGVTPPVPVLWQTTIREIVLVQRSLSRAGVQRGGGLRPTGKRSGARFGSTGARCRGTAAH